MNLGSDVITIVLFVQSSGWLLLMMLHPHLVSVSSLAIFIISRMSFYLGLVLLAKTVIQCSLMHPILLYLVYLGGIFD